MKVLIIIPCYNEEESICKVVNNIVTNYPEYDYIVINDCSTDSTKEICQKNHFNHISLCTNLGIGGCVQTGYRYASEHHYDYAVQIDGDGQHNPKYIKDMIEVAVEQKCDMVIGSRFLDKKGFQSSLVRRLGISWINRIIRLCCGVRITDATSGLRVVSRTLAAFFSKHYAEDYPEPEAIVESSLNGYQITEYAVIMEERKGGRSSINVLRSIYYMVKVTMALFIHRINTKKV